MTHEFLEVAGVKVREVRFNGEAELIQQYVAVHPRVMPAGTVLVHVWLPPRKDAAGKPMETERLRFFVCPVGDAGPLVSEVTKMMDGAELPKQVRTEPIKIPPEISVLKKHADLDTFAAPLHIKFPEGASVEVKQSLLAKQCQSDAGKQLLERLRVAKQSAERKPEPSIP